MSEKLVGETGFEPATLCSQSTREPRNSAGLAVEQRENAGNGINAVGEGCLTDLGEDDTPTKPEIGHTPDHGIEAAARAHCDFFGGEGWWDAGLLADTKPKAIEAMRVALAAWNHRTPVHDAAHDLLEALRPFAELKLAKKPVGNAGIYSIFYSRIEAARAAIARALPVGGGE